MKEVNKTSRAQQPPYINSVIKNQTHTVAYRYTKLNNLGSVGEGLGQRQA